MRAARGSSVPSSRTGYQGNMTRDLKTRKGDQESLIGNLETRTGHRTDKSVERVDEPDYRGVGEPVDPQLAATDELLGNNDLLYIHKQLIRWMTFMQSYWYLICLMFFRLL